MADINWRFWKREPTAIDVTPVDLQQAYQLGHHNGYWAGVLAGRRAAVEDMEVMLAAKGKTTDELTTDDLALAKVKLVH